jgi:hypothetical protein
MDACMTAFEPRIDPVSITAPTANRAAVVPQWETLFNEDRFHALNVVDGQRVVRADAADARGRVIGALAGVLDGPVFTSGYSAPFGGVDLARDRETPENVAQVVDTALIRLTNEGAGTARVKLPPCCYGENEALVQFTLLNRGFAVERCECNQHIDLSPLADTDAYVRRLKSPARRALGKLLVDGAFAYRRAADDRAWQRAYATLTANRAAKGRTLSLSAAYIARARAALGDSVRMYELFHGQQAVAAALVYRVRQRCDLVVAWGDAGHDLERSPMNLLAYHVVAQAIADGVHTIDLGTSNGHGPGPDGRYVPDAGLVQFKQSLLARVEPRLTLVRELER